MHWYQVKNVAQIDSPALLIYKDRIQHNIETMIANVGGDPNRLFPHVKTHKMAEVVQMQREAGIQKFKCATIAEMEMTLTAGAEKVLIAYQMTGPKIDRLAKLASKFRDRTIASLVDNLQSAKSIAKAFSQANLTANVYLDIDNGLNRTGCTLDASTFDLIKAINELDGINFVGLHVYDGQFRMSNMADRKIGSDAAFRPIYGLLNQIQSELNIDAEVVSGGSPSFTSAAMRSKVYCSPGTVLLWDVGYAKIIPELDLKWAAVLLTRVISKPAKGIITVDLGHKSVGSENPMKNRIHFLNLTNYEAYQHSEEHLMIKVKNWEAIEVGMVLYGVPFHVCPSVALHDEAYVIQNHEWLENWSIIARRRKITV